MATLARFRWLVVMTFLGSLAGFLGSYLLSPRYRARAVLEDIFPTGSSSPIPIGKSASRQRLLNYLDQAFSPKILRPIIERQGIAKAEEVEKVYREIRKNIQVQPEGDDNPLLTGLSADVINADLIYTDSTPQRADRLCSVLIAALREKTRIDDEAFLASHSAADFEGFGSHPYRVNVVFPCGTSDTPDISHPLLCAAIGSATGLLVGIALIAVRKTTLAQFADPRC
jgi:hypothetical protein